MYGAVRVFCFENGTADVAAAIVGDGLPLYERSLKATGKDRYNYSDYTAEVKITVGFAPRGEVRCYHNYRPLTGGTHLERALTWIVRRVQWQYMGDEAYENYDEDTIRQHLVLIIESCCENRATMWADRVMRSISNRMITDMTVDLVGDDFSYYLKQNRNAVALLLEDMD